MKNRIELMELKLKAGELSPENCSIILSDILDLNKQIAECTAKDDYYFTLVEYCYSCYLMIDKYFY
jgi:hypothetical protein